MSKETQCEKILRYMKTYKSITQRDAFRLGVYRLGARVFDLKEQGHLIKTNMVAVKNADGSISHIAVYTLAEE